MMYTDSTSCRDGNIPDIIKWMYRMFLLHHGMVTEHRVDLTACGGLIERYDIIGYNKDNTTVTLEVTIDRLTGDMSGRMEQSRSRVPVYELGSSQPVEYLIGKPLVMRTK